jgi:YD repeat-containing protein
MMFKHTYFRFYLILSMVIAPTAYGVGSNPDNTWYRIFFHGQLTDHANTIPKAYAKYDEAEAALRSAIAYGNKLVLEDTIIQPGRTDYYFKFDTEDVVAGDVWTYKSGYGGGFDDAQGAIDAFFAVNNYSCITEKGPLGAWKEGGKWYCYPPSEPMTNEIATYNLQICTGNKTVDVDPVICRHRKDHCPEHTPTYIPSYRNTDPKVHGGGEFCLNSTYGMITKFKCECNETGITGLCTRIPAHYEMSFDRYGVYHYYLVADDPQYNPLNCPEKIEIPQKQCTEGDGFKGNPVNITNGCKVQQETDYAPRSSGDLRVTRNYSSTTITAGLDLPKPYEENRFSDKTELCSGGDFQESTKAGSQLSQSNLDWRLEKRSDCPSIINLYTPNGSKYIFAKMDSPPDTGTWYESDNPNLGRLQYGGLYYNYYDSNGRTYNFSSGRLRSIAKDNKITKFSYNGDSRLSTVTDNYGNELRYAYDGSGRIITIETPDGAIGYNYDDTGNLTEVIYPDNTPGDDTDNPRKHYLFEDSRFPNALTGIINENGVRFASWTYDAYGRAISSEHNGGADKHEFEYLDGTTTLVRKYLDSGRFLESSYTHEIYNGRNVVTSITPLACDNCALGNTVRKYDPLSGDLISSQDPNGIITIYEYDSRHRQVKRTIAVGTPQERVIETVWDEALNKPLRVIEPDRITQYRYDDAGHLLSKTERDVK